MAEVNGYSLEQFCDELESLVSREQDIGLFLPEAQSLLKKLLPNRDFVGDVLAKMVADDAFLKGSIGTIDRNDIILYLSSRGSFSMRLFTWMPSVTYPIHDHGSWGIMGGYASDTGETRYRRLDDGLDENRAQLEGTGQGIIHTGETGSVHPFGIHRMYSTNDQVSLTVHVYGRALRKGYVQRFNRQSGSQYNVGKLITPKLEKRIFAVRALGAIGGDAAAGNIEKAFRDAHPLVRWESLLAMEKVNRDTWQTLLKEASNDASPELSRKAGAALDKL